MSTTHHAKSKAKQFLHKLFESDKSDGDQSAGPPKPPPKLTVNSSGVTHTKPSSAVDPGHQLAQAFNNISLSETHNKFHIDPDFVGGFSPGYTQPHARPQTSHVPPYAQFPDAFPRPHAAPYSPVMPPPLPPQNGKHSLTMQMALQPPDKYNTPLPPPSFPRPYSASVLPVPPPNLSPSSSQSPSSVSLPPTTPNRPRLSSSSSSTTSTTSTQQCAGVTKAGKQCSRQVKTGPALSRRKYAEDSAGIDRFCFQHIKELLGPTGFYARKTGDWVKFEDWIPSYLQADTQAALRVEMEKSRSQSDVPGYIYTFEIRDTSSGTVKLKVGRAVNLVKRIDQWGKQCGSKEQVLRGWYPGTVEPDNSGDMSLMKGRIKAGEKGPWCHRLERLIHLELADIIATGVYLDPKWPHPKPLEATPSKASSTKNAESNTCVDCGSVHKEIFEFTKFKKGRYVGKEWDSIVKPVIERWGKFVETCV